MGEIWDISQLHIAWVSHILRHEIVMLNQCYSYVSTDMIAKANPTPQEKAYAAKWQDMTPVDRSVLAVNHQHPLIFRQICCTL